MTYQELKAAALPDLARMVIDAAADVAARLAAFESLNARAAEIWAAGAWLGYDDSERAALRAAFAIDADAMARRGFTAA